MAWWRPGVPSSGNGQGGGHRLAAMRFQPPWSGAFRLQSYVHRTPEALPADTVEAIRAAILGSPLLAATNLSKQFSGTYGFS